MLECSRKSKAGREDFLLTVRSKRVRVALHKIFVGAISSAWEKKQGKVGIKSKATRKANWEKQSWRLPEKEGEPRGKRA